MDFLVERQEEVVHLQLSRSNSLRYNSKFLQGIAAIGLLFVGTLPGNAVAQQSTTPPASGVATQQGLPVAPQPAPVADLRPTARNFQTPRGYWPNPFAPYTATTVEPANTSNAPLPPNLVRDGKIYLSLSDAIILALENNYDIAIQRYNLDIADTEILRAKSGTFQLLGVPTGLVTNTIGSTGSTLTSGGGPGGTSVGAGGAGAGASGLVLTTNGLGPIPEVLDPTLSGTLEGQRQTTPQTSSFAGAVTTTNTEFYNFTYNQGWITGTSLQVGFDNSRIATSAPFTNYSPALQSSFTATFTQHLLQGFGPGINGRFILEAKNTRKISDAAFREQILYTINQVENIYWGLVSAYEDVQSKERSLQQSKQLASDNRKQLQIGTLAPLDVVQSDSNVASDQQALVNSQSNLKYQQLIMAQAVSRTLGPTLANAPVIPTDRVSILETPEERMSVEDLEREADANRPEIQQAILVLKNDEITLKGVKNGLLPTVDLYGFYGAAGVGGQRGPNCVVFNSSFQSVPCTEQTTPTIGYGTVFQNLFNSSGPDKGVGLNVSIPIRNRLAQSEQVRSVLEYRQAQMRLQQLYVQIRMQVINGQFALTNDRAQVESAMAAQEYNRQSLDSEQKKYHLGASTTANVLLQQRNLSGAENSLISAQAKYATDRAALSQILADTLVRYGINIDDAVSGNVRQAPVIPGLQSAKAAPEVQVPGQQQQLQKQEHAPAQPQQPEMPAQPPVSPETTPPPPSQPPQ